jgi:hypothetical protein
MLYYQNIFKSIVEFSSYYIALSLSLGFWGRYLVKFAKIKDGVGFGEPLTLMAGLAWFIWLAQALFPFLDNYKYYFILFYYIGLIGSIFEIIIISPRFFKNSKNLLKIIQKLYNKNESFCITIIIGIVISLIYSMIWVSGTTEIWMNNKADFYNWLILSESIRGNIDLNIVNNYGLYDFMKVDSIGTLLILGLLGTANGSSLLLSAPYCVITVLTWEFTAIYFIIKRCIGFKTIYAVIISILLLSSPLVNYIAIYGFFGQIIATICFLTILSQLKFEIQTIKLKNKIKILILPMFVLFTSYQSGYMVFLLFIIYINFLINFFNEHKKIKIKRFIAALQKSTIPFIMITIIIAAIMPGIAYHLIHRTLMVVQQTAGWPLPYLGPWYFIGLPLYQEGFFFNIESYDTTNIKLYYILYIIFLFNLLIYYTKIKREKFKSIYFTRINYLFNNNISLNYLISLLNAYILSLVVYFIIFYFFTGNIYRIWKFATFTTLPISFIPLVSLNLLIALQIKKIYNIISKYMLIAILNIFLFKFICGPPLIHLPIKYFDIYSAMPILDNLYKIQPIIKNKDKVLIHTQEPSKCYLITLFLNDLIPKINLYYISGFYFSTKPDYFYLINEKSIILSTFNYNFIYNGTNIDESFESIFLYDFDRLNKIGYAAIISGKNPFTWEFENKLLVKFRVPNNLKNKEFTLSLDLEVKDSNNNCNYINFSVLDINNKLIWFETDISKISLLTSNNYINNNILSLFIHSSDNLCRYSISGVKIN